MFFFFGGGGGGGFGNKKKIIIFLTRLYSAKHVCFDFVKSTEVFHMQMKRVTCLELQFLA